MTQLARLLEDMQRCVLTGDRTFGPRLAIYQRAYRARLVEALALAYPVLKDSLGPRRFNAAATAYIAATPSAQRSIRWYGASFDRGFRGMHADLARWEWLLGEVFDAADDTAMTLEALARVDPAAWPALRLRLHGTLRFYTSTSNAVACWKALGAGERSLPALDIDTAISWVVWRRDLRIRFRSVPADEARALAQLATGASFSALCDVLAAGLDAHGAAVRAATLLKGWIGEGLIGVGLIGRRS